MSPLAEVALVASREVRKNLRSAKGIVLLVLSVVGGTSVALLMTKLVQRQIADLALTPEQVQAAQEQLFTKASGDPAVGKYMATAPLALVQTLVLSVWLSPLLIALTGFDAVSGEVQYRSVRYWTIRTRRGSFYVGKLMGLWLTVSAITFGMNVAMWVVAIARGGSSVGSTLGWGGGFWLMTLPIGVLWCAIATLVGSLFRQPILSLLVTFATFFAIWVVGFGVAHAQDLQWLGYLYPNFYEDWLMSPHPEKVGGAVGICAGAAAILAGAGATLFARSDV